MKSAGELLQFGEGTGHSILVTTPVSIGLGSATVQSSSHPRFSIRHRGLCCGGVRGSVNRVFK